MSDEKVLLKVLMVTMVFVLSSCVQMSGNSYPIALGWEDLLADNLSNCTFKHGSWTMDKGVLTRQGGGDIWTKESYGDFILELEFKVAKGTNSGIFFRTEDVNDPVQTGIEMQVYDSFGRRKPDKYDCGAIYDCLAPTVNAVKAPGQWNRVTILAKGSMISIVMNGKRIIDMDLNDWTEPHMNPDGTPNKFNTAYKDMARQGAIGFQDHGKPVWYRNIKVKRLD